MFVKVLRRTPSRSWTRCWWRSSRSGRPPSPWANREWGSCQLQSRRRKEEMAKKGVWLNMRKSYLLVWLVTVAGFTDPQDLPSTSLPFPSTIWTKGIGNQLHRDQNLNIATMRYRQIVPAATPVILEAECSEGHLDPFSCSRTDLVGLVLDDQTSEKI